jgi:hypothetical protein
MPAPFTRELCGYRGDSGNPNTSDNGDDLSIRLGRELLGRLGVPQGQTGPNDQGAELENAVMEHLKAVRPDLKIERSRSATAFAQYAHLDVFQSFLKSYAGSQKAMGSLAQAIEQVPAGRERQRLVRAFDKLTGSVADDAITIDKLKREMPEESLLKIDISVAVPQDDGTEELAIALSAKWSLRTDRAQDCVSQGSKLVAQRRGKMPHFAVVTIEPRPSMLRILADGSGAVDWVYHLDLPALEDAINAESERTRNPESWSPRKTFDRLMAQRRLKDFDELVRQVEGLPAVGG